MSAERFTCSGCGRSSTKVYSGGLYIIPATKRAVTILLCEACAADAQRDPDAMTKTVEARLMAPRGTA